MFRFACILMIITLPACGVTETTTAAATGAAAKAQEAKQAGKTKEQFEEKLENVNQQLQERADQQE
jgi:hypothetical protein